MKRQNRMKSFRIKSLTAILLLLIVFAGIGCQSSAPLPGERATDSSVPFERTEDTDKINANVPARQFVAPKVVAPIPTESFDLRYDSIEDLPAPKGTYKNVDGLSVPRPYAAPSASIGASARCRDGTYSFSQNRRGTCSHHGGVAVWL